MKKAFTMLELVFVIAVVAIIASTVFSTSKSNSLQEAAIQMLSDIRYTQHLAIIDDRFDPSDDEWYKEKWQFIYGKSDSGDKNSGGYYAYTIFSDFKNTHSGNPDPDEMAINPLNRDKKLSGGYSGTLDWEDSEATLKLNIGSSYGIDDITKDGCSAQRVAFDNLGRPYSGNDSNWDSPTDGLLTETCTFTLHKDGKTVSIYIEPETGYIHF